MLRITDGDRIATGNAMDSAFNSCRGWFIGPFWEPDVGLRCSGVVEVKWSNHVADSQKIGVSGRDGTTSLAVLVSGSFLFTFPDEDPAEVTLGSQGDYVMYGPSVLHTWKALEDSIVMTVRWVPEILPDGSQGNLTDIKRGHRV
ncbi:signal peptidase I [Streptomyces griseorubiginosus]|uniref:signal peptidase I n=1 Tax=Streptomyces griseorubiginosus TaxID=67304 RepID=UPI0033C5C49A